MVLYRSKCKGFFYNSRNVIYTIFTNTFVTHLISSKYTVNPNFHAVLFQEINVITCMFLDGWSCDSQAVFFWFGGWIDTLKSKINLLCKYYCSCICQYAVCSRCMLRMCKIQVAQLVVHHANDTVQSRVKSMKGSVNGISKFKSLVGECAY